MAYVYTWDTADPTGTDLVSDGARVIREDVKGALNERLLTVFTNLTSDPLTFKALTLISTTTPQLTVKYDGSNYLTLTVSAAGAVTLNATGTGAGFVFSDSIAVTAANNSVGASRLVSAYTAGIGIQYAYGADAATNGRYQLISRRSDDSNSLVFLDFSVAGLLTLANGLTVSSGTTTVQGLSATTGTFSDNLGTATTKKLGLNAGFTSYLDEFTTGNGGVRIYHGGTLGMTVCPGGLSVIFPNQTQLYVNTTEKIQSSGATQIAMYANNQEAVAASRTVTARDTYLMIYDVDNATLERVTVGIADSGGAGFKLLRIPN